MVFNSDPAAAAGGSGSDCNKLDTSKRELSGNANLDGDRGHSGLRVCAWGADEKQSVVAQPRLPEPTLGSGSWFRTGYHDSDYPLSAPGFQARPISGAISMPRSRASELKNPVKLQDFVVDGKIELSLKNYSIW